MSRTIHAKKLETFTEICKRKRKQVKGKLKTFQTQSLSNYWYSVDLPFFLALTKKLYVIKTPGHAADLLSFGLKQDRQFASLQECGNLPVSSCTGLIAKGKELYSKLGLSSVDCKNVIYEKGLVK